MDRFDITIIGAGVAGLAVAEKLSGRGVEVAVVEKNESFGQETSSRNSEVIHSGIYYPAGSLKLKMCLEGSRQLYEICEKNRIPFERTGKLIAAFSREDEEKLEGLFNNGKNNGIEGLELLSAEDAARQEPNLKCLSAILCKTTGILDSHSLMKHLKTSAEAKGAAISFSSEATAVEKIPGGFLLTVKEPGREYRFKSGAVVNSAGLYAEKAAKLAGIDTKEAGYGLVFCKGEYFSAGGKYRDYYKKLIYPVPAERGLGIHTVKDLQGRLRFGPSDFIVTEIDYSVDSSHRQEFFEAAKKYIPEIGINELEPDMSGIRPQVEPKNGVYRDFIIKEETDRGLSGFINLIGIESPGLTSAPAIAEYVGKLLNK